MIESFGLRTDSGGPGRIPRRPRPGAPLSDAGAVPHLDALRAHALSRLGASTAAATAQSGHVLIERTDGTTQVALKETVMLNAGDRVRIRTGGGGGYGDPQRRDRERVRTDVMRGYVSPEAAREVYGLDTKAS